MPPVAGGLALPTLGSAGAALSDDDLDDLSIGSGEGADELPVDDVPRSGDGPALRPDGPSADLLRALDIELPQVEGQWQDDDLERVLRAMDAHYGDAAPQLDDAEWPEEGDDE